MAKMRYHLIDTIRCMADKLTQLENQNKLLMDEKKTDLVPYQSALFHLQTYYHFLMGQQLNAETLMKTPPDVLEGKVPVPQDEISQRKIRKNGMTPNIFKKFNPEEGD